MSVGKSLRTALGRFKAALEAHRASLPQTAAAFSALQAAVDAEAPTRGSKRPAGRSAPYAVGEACLIKRLRNRVVYLQRTRDVLKQALRRRARTGGKISSLLLSTVALSAPPPNARAFARAMRDLVGAKEEAVSRTTIESIRDAFVGEAKRVMEDAAAAHLGRVNLPLKEAAAAPRHDVAVTEAAARAGRTNFAVVACLTHPRRGVAPVAVVRRHGHRSARPG